MPKKSKAAAPLDETYRELAALDADFTFSDSELDELEAATLADLEKIKSGEMKLAKPKQKKGTANRRPRYWTALRGYRRDLPSRKKRGWKF